MQPRAMGRKVSDEFAVPLCRIHHREVHRASDEQAWWKQARIDPIEAARTLWSNTRLNGGALQAAELFRPLSPGGAARPVTENQSSQRTS
jgi:hypothetical protein